jgi:hypothetical protein
VDTAPTSASIASRLIQITRSIEGIASACPVASRMTKLSSCALRRDLNGVLLVALRALSVMLPARSGGEEAGSSGSSMLASKSEKCRRYSKI